MKENRDKKEIREAMDKKADEIRDDEPYAIFDEDGMCVYMSDKAAERLCRFTAICIGILTLPFLLLAFLS